MMMRPPAARLRPQPPPINQSIVNRSSLIARFWRGAARAADRSAAEKRQRRRTFALGVGCVAASLRGLRPLPSHVLDLTSSCLPLCLESPKRGQLPAIHMNTWFCLPWPRIPILNAQIDRSIRPSINDRQAAAAAEQQCVARTHHHHLTQQALHQITTQPHANMASIDDQEQEQHSSLLLSSSSDEDDDGDHNTPMVAPPPPITGTSSTTNNRHRGAGQQQQQGQQQRQRRRAAGAGRSRSPSPPAAAARRSQRQPQAGASGGGFAASGASSAGALVLSMGTAGTDMHDDAPGVLLADLRASLAAEEAREREERRLRRVLHAQGERFAAVRVLIFWWGCGGLFVVWYMAAAVLSCPSVT